MTDSMTIHRDTSLVAKGLWFGYGAEWILENASITVEAGEVVGLWGPSGSGKSTFARVLTGHLLAQRGSVSAPTPRGRAHSAQLVLQHSELSMNPRWKIREVLSEADAEIEPAIHWGLMRPSWLDAFPHELSGGELQRVNLARALLARPAFLVADEITTSVDALTQARIWRLLLRVVRADGCGMLVVSHDLPLLKTVTDRITTMAQLADGHA